MQIIMSKKSSYVVVFLLFAVLQIITTTTSFMNAYETEEEGSWSYGTVVKRDQRQTLVSTEYGHISAVRVTDNINGSYLLHFFNLEPNALFLPVVLHADMIFYVHTGSGRLSWTEEDDLKHAVLRPGDVYRLQQGSVFFLQSNLEAEAVERRRLRVYTIFTEEDMRAPVTGPYSSVRDMVLGFDRKVLLAAFKVPEEVIDELMSGIEQPPIIQRRIEEESKRTAWEIETAFVRGLLARSRNYNIFELNKKKKEKGDSSKLFNLFKEDKDFENCNGWSTTVTRKKLSALKGSNVGIFMVNLTVGSMMGPHWNPTGSEISVVLQGRGMVRVVCSSSETGCNNMRFEVEEGDVFAVPRYHPMAQMSFNNETLVFVGFSTSNKKNYPQFLAGQASVLRTLDQDVLAMSFNVTNTTMDQLLASQEDSVILGCVSCAEEELRIMEEERGREREEPRESEEEAREREERERREREERERREREEREREQEREGKGEGERQEEEGTSEGERAEQEERERERRQHQQETREEEEGRGGGQQGEGTEEISHENGEWGRRIWKKKKLTV